MDPAKDLLREQKRLQKQAKYYNEFVSACRLGNLEFVKKCVNDGIDVNIFNEDGKTGLMMGALHEKLNIVQYLIQQRATDVSITGGHYDGWSALHYASRYNKKGLEILKLILNRKPPGHEHETDKKELFNKKDKDGYTPLDHVYRRKFSDESNINRRDLILLLKSHGCKSNFYDKNGVWVGKSNGDLNK